MGGHGMPVEDMECMCCMEDINSENYVEYRTGEGNAWKAALFCEGCIEVLLKLQWKQYVDGLAKTTCKAEQRRMLANGPPINVSDRTALPCLEGESVHSLWYSRDKQVHSAKLEGSLEGEERQAWWDEKLAFQFEEAEDEDS
ncbi:unnamed protein product [Choristocarpus tenellus]